jgi:hypothetical protein
LYASGQTAPGRGAAALALPSHAAAPCWSWPRFVRFAFVFDSVDEDEAAWVNTGLTRLPTGLFARDVGAILLTGQHGFFEAETVRVDELPHRPVIDLQAALGQLGHQPAQGERCRCPLDQPVAVSTGDLGRRDAATARTLSPAARRDIARARKSIDKALVIAAALQSSTQLESENQPHVNPVSIQPSFIPL